MLLQLSFVVCYLSAVYKKPVRTVLPNVPFQLFGPKKMAETSDLVIRVTEPLSSSVSDNEEEEEHVIPSPTFPFITPENPLPLPIDGRPARKKMRSFIESDTEYYSDTNKEEDYMNAVELLAKEGSICITRRACDQHFNFQPECRCKKIHVRICIHCFNQWSARIKCCSQNSLHSVHCKTFDIYTDPAVIGQTYSRTLVSQLQTALAQGTWSALKDTATSIVERYKHDKIVRQAMWKSIFNHVSSSWQEQRQSNVCFL